MLQKKENIAGLFLHPRLGQLILQLEGGFIVDQTQPEGTADMLFLIRRPHTSKISSGEGGVNMGQGQKSMANDH
jgi:hypothetical protein